MHVGVFILIDWLLWYNFHDSNTCVNFALKLITNLSHASDFKEGGAGAIVTRLLIKYILKSLLIL